MIRVGSIVETFGEEGLSMQLRHRRQTLSQSENHIQGDAVVCDDECSYNGSKSKQNDGGYISQMTSWFSPQTPQTDSDSPPTPSPSPTPLAQSPNTPDLDASLEIKPEWFNSPSFIGETIGAAKQSVKKTKTKTKTTPQLKQTVGFLIFFANIILCYLLFRVLGY